MATMTIHMESDWGVGSGTGTIGLADWSVAKDANDMPYIPAKSLTGVLRESARQAARALDGPESTTWTSWLEWLFGSEPASQARRHEDGSLRAPFPAVLSIRPAHTRPADEPTAVRPAIEVDSETGTATPGHFRLLEVARYNLPLTATISAQGFTSLADLPEPAQVLLGLAVALTDSVGGKRRRGLGRCRITVDELPEGAELAAVLDGIDVPDHPPAQAPAEQSNHSITAPAGTFQLVAYVDVITRTPVTVQPKVTGNTIVTAQVIPGTTLLPKIARAVGPAAGALIRAGDLVVTDALPVEQRSGQRCFPVPRTLKRAKRPGADEPLQFYGPNVDLAGQPKMTGVTGFVADPAEGDAELVNTLVHTEVPVEQRAHAVIDDDQQRPTSESGGLYIQQAISPRVHFRAEVWSTLPISPTNSEDYLVGRSKKDDYGQVELTICVVEEFPQTISTRHASNDGDITMRLLSDLLVRDPLTGEFTTVLDRVAAGIAQQWGVDELTCDLAHTHLAVNAIDSWQVRWGLPRPTLLAVAAGSVITLKGKRAIDGKILDTAEKRGVGDRRAEGFGRVRFNDPLAEPSTKRCLDVTEVPCMISEGGEWA